MIRGIIGRKIGMTQIFDEDGKVIPVTVIEAGPCTITHLKTLDKDGYTAAQLAFDNMTKPRRLTKPMMGHCKPAGIKGAYIFREFKVEKDDEYEVGQEVKVDIFEAKEKVKVTGTSKGKGFQGVVKRYGFSGGPEGHGSMFHRRAGSIGASADPSRVFRGHKMPGRTGGDKVTISNLEVQKIDVEKNILLIKGCVPGANGSYVMIRKQSAKK